MVYWKTLLEHLDWDQNDEELLTPTAIFRVLKPMAATIICILRARPTATKSDFATKDHLKRLLVVPPITEEHIRQAYKSAKLALAVLLADLPKAVVTVDCAEIVGHIPGSSVENGLQDAIEILRVLANHPFQALITALNMRDISHFTRVMDEAWEFQEKHTLFAAPSPNDVTPADVFYPEARNLRSQSKCPMCKADVDRNALADAGSKREFDISGMCQQCQDSVFD